MIIGSTAIKHFYPDFPREPKDLDFVIFEDEKIPLSTMLQHILMFYKYGGKQLYYFNTFDGQGEVDINKLDDNAQLDDIILEDEAACDSCVI